LYRDRTIRWSVHCHNDLGLALDNTMTAIFSGPARQIEGCINGVGERAGNVSLEQCIILIEQFGKEVHSEYSFYTDINLEMLTSASDFIAQKMLARQPHWPITGENAARHSSGGHTNAVLRNPMAYQPFNPTIVGKQISFVFGPLSGSNHVKEILEKNGFNCPNEEKTTIAQAIKNHYSDRRKGITDEELIAGFMEFRAPIKVSEIDYAKDDHQNVKLHIQGQFFNEQDIVVHSNDGNSALAALDKAVKKYFPSIEIIDYRSNACAGSTVNAKCNSTVIVCIAGCQNFIGKAIDADINLSAIKAYIQAVNHAYVYTNFKINEDVYVA
jgi:2-isopropylmalate synthase